MKKIFAILWQILFIAAVSYALLFFVLDPVKWLITGNVELDDATQWITMTVLVTGLLLQHKNGDGSATLFRGYDPFLVGAVLVMLFMTSCSNSRREQHKEDLTTIQKQNVLIDKYAQYYISTEHMLDSLGVMGDHEIFMRGPGIEYLDSKEDLDNELDEWQIK